MNTNRTTDEIYVSAEPATPAEQMLRFVDVHIYDFELEEAANNENQLDLEPAQPDEGDQKGNEPPPVHHRRRNIITLCVGIVWLFVISALVMVHVFPLLTPDATITIVPNTQQIRSTANVLVNTRLATGTQIQGRTLPTITMSQARTVTTTGKGHQNAEAAHGFITFYNAATYPQTVTSGTLLTGSDGVSIVTDQDATIPAAQYPTFGQQSVLARAVIAGLEENIRAGDIYGPCCRLSISAVNSVFTGGQQARDYQTVALQDISTVVSSLKTSLNQSVQAALQTQVHADETLITPFPCQQSVKPDHQPGEEVTQVQITVSEICTGTTYTTQAYQNRILQIANKQTGDGYTPIRQIQSTILQAIHQDQSHLLLHVTIAQTYAYQVSQEQQQYLKTLIAGKNKAQATNTLLRNPGIQSVSINSTTIPTDTQHIHVIVVYVG